MRDPFPRGTYIGVPHEPQKDEADHFYRCKVCGGLVDKRDLGAVLDHEPGGSHPAEDKPN